jgi:4-amino-4-deoxy-L-arabinose transferase-like glycosyltransferase
VRRTLATSSSCRPERQLRTPGLAGWRATEPEAGLRRLLWLGLAIRIVVFPFLPPLNADGAGHLEYLAFIASTHSSPPASYGNETYQPPLYYLLASIFWAATNNAKCAQLFSLVCSIATLWLYYWLIATTDVIRGEMARLLAFALVALLPQFVMFGLYVSNDTLATLLGILVMCQTWRSIRAPETRHWVLLAVMVGLGLLTKASFIPYVPILALLVGWVHVRRWGVRAGAVNAAGFVFLCLPLPRCGRV